MLETHFINRRMHRRLPVAPMYTTIAAKRSDADGVRWAQGHAYDISEGGVRIELDEALAPGETVVMRIGLPGTEYQLCADGKVVWVNDDVDDPGPRRMALRFSQFGSEHDRQRLARYLSSHWTAAAA